MTVTSIRTYAIEEKIVKVAYILDHGNYVTEENGGLSGYSYDYLMLVAQHTGWVYEFVEIDEGSYEKSCKMAKEMLQTGVVDLLDSVIWTEENEEIFEFPSQNTGISRHNLVSLANNYKITQDNYFLKDSLTVALVEGAEVNEAFYALSFGRELELDVVFVEDYEKTVELLVNEEVDAIISADTSAESWMMNYLTTVERTPFYFVSSKGNTALMEELNLAISNIEVEEPNVHQRLLADYFATLHSGNIILTHEEQEALADYPYLTIGLLKGREPYQFYIDDNEQVPQGISVEILEEISEIIGMEFRYVWLDSREEMKEKIANQEIDICSTVPYDSDFQLNHYFDVVITQPYLTNAVTWLHQSGRSADGKPLYYYLADNIPLFPDEELTEVFDFEEALLDLSESGGVSIFADPYMAQYMIQKLELTNIEMQTISTVESNISFGVGKHLDSAVVGLLNHALLHLDPFVVDEIIYNNVTVQGGQTVEAFMREHSFEILSLITLALIGIVTFLVLNGRKLKRITQQDSLTKLYNAGFFHTYAEKSAKKMTDGGLILVDIDFFKDVNDTHGHQAGDAVIITVANTLKKFFRSNDIVARLGGDEFIILIENRCHKDDLEERLENILAELVKEEQKVPVTLSMGAYLFDKTVEYDVLYRLADEELYKVKEKGRNGFSVSS